MDPLEGENSIKSTKVDGLPRGWNFYLIHQSGQTPPEGEKSTKWMNSLRGENFIKSTKWTDPPPPSPVWKIIQINKVDGSHKKVKVLSCPVHGRMSKKKKHFLQKRWIANGYELMLKQSEQIYSTNEITHQNINKPLKKSVYILFMMDKNCSPNN